jgi:hypothetical protein
MEPTDRRQLEAALRQCLDRLRIRQLRQRQEALLASEESGVPTPRHLEPEIESVNAGIRELSG